MTFWGERVWCAAVWQVVPVSREGWLVNKSRDLAFLCRLLTRPLGGQRHESHCNVVCPTGALLPPDLTTLSLRLRSLDAAGSDDVSVSM